MRSGYKRGQKYREDPALRGVLFMAFVVICIGGAVGLALALY